MATRALCGFTECPLPPKVKFTCTICKLGYCSNGHKKADHQRHKKVHKAALQEIKTLEAKAPTVEVTSLPSGLEHVIVSGEGRDCCQFESSKGQITVRDLTLGSGPKVTTFEAVTLVFEGAFNFTPHSEGKTKALCIKVKNLTFRPGASIRSAGLLLISADFISFEGDISLHGKDEKTPLDLRLSGKKAQIIRLDKLVPCAAIQRIYDLNAQL